MADAKIDITPIILAALPVARDLVSLIIDAVQAAQDDDVTPEQIDRMMDSIRGRGAVIDELIEEIRAKREG